jgi:catechol 2,3-dioxygenase-like lactoylglutathione lyase family enzyme
MRIGLVSIFVDDQDQAERFYTEVLGLQVKDSAPTARTSAGPRSPPRSPMGWIPGNPAGLCQ